MAEKPASSDEGVICSLCRRSFQDPKLLECLHYYCRECIQERADKAGPDQPFVCPDCGKPTSIPANGAGDLDTVSFVVRKLNTELYRKAMEAQSEKMQCEECYPESMLESESPTTTDTVAQFFCQNCHKFICGFCMKAHKRQKRYKDHIVVTIEEVQQNKGRHLHPQENHCKDHQKPLRYYCRDCEEVICTDCLLGQYHDTHRRDEIGNCGTESRKQLQDDLSPLSTDKAKIMVAIDETDKVKSQILSQVEKTKAKIIETFAAVKKVTRYHEQQLLASIDRRCQVKSEVLDHQLQTLRSAQFCIQHLVSFVGQCLDGCSDVEIMLLWKRINEKLQEIKRFKNNLTLEPAEADVVADFEVDVSCCVEEVKQVLQKHAVLCVLQADPSQCEAEGDGISKAETNTVARFTFYAKYHNGKVCEELQIVTAELKSRVDGSIIQGEVECKNASTYEVSYCPKIRGRHELTICINGDLIADSPFHVFVSHPPTELKIPVRCITGLKRPYGAAFNHEGHLLVTESISSRPDHEATNHIHSSGTPAGIAIISVADGTIIERKAQSRLNNPAGVAVDEDGCVYVIDNESENESVIKYGKDWSLMESAGSKGDFTRPGRVEISPKNELYICDRGNHRIKVYDTNLVYCRLFGSPELKRPVDIAFDGDGNVYVTELHGDCVLKLSPDGEKLQQIGKYGSQPGRLGAPRGILIHQNCIYVCERDNRRVSVFQTDGTFVTAFGAEAGLRDPASIVVDKDGFIYVCDEENACVVVF